MTQFKRHDPQTSLPLTLQRRMVSEAIAHKAHLRALIEIRRHMFRHHKRCKWKAKSIHFSLDIVKDKQRFTIIPFYMAGSRDEQREKYITRELR